MTRLLRGLGLLSGGAGLGLLAYAAGIEPYAIETVHLDLFAPRLPEAFEGYTIVQVSDLHMRQMGRRERLLETLLRDLPPADLVAVTGDLVHTPAGISPFLALAQAFRARDGAYAVFGNSEHKKRHPAVCVFADSGRAWHPSPDEPARSLVSRRCVYCAGRGRRPGERQR